MMLTDRTTTIPALSKQGGQTNLPGIRRLWLIESRHVAKWVDPRQVAGATCAGWVVAENGFNLCADAVIYDWRFSASKGDYQEKVVTTVQGVQYEQAIKLSLPRANPNTALALMRMTGRKWLAIYTDGNGLVRLVGTPKQPLRFAHNLLIGRNEQQLAWQCSTRLPAIYLAEADARLLGSFLSYQSTFFQV